MLHGEKATGQVLLLNSRSGPAEEVLPDAGSPRSSSDIELAIRYGPRHDYPSKYGKFAYSTHFPFNVAPIPGSYAPDAMLALSPDGQVFGHRGVTLDSGAAPGMIWCEFVEKVAGQISPHPRRSIAKQGSSNPPVLHRAGFSRSGF